MRSRRPTKAEMAADLKEMLREEDRRNFRVALWHFVDAAILVWGANGTYVRDSLADALAEQGLALPRTKGHRPLPKGLRQQILDRDGRTCRACGTTDRLTIDHIYPVSLGGTDDEDNLQVLCQSCNSIKGARLP